MRHPNPAALLVSALVATLAAGGPSQDLAVRTRIRFGVLPAAMASPSNPITAAKVRLGRALFHETRVSIDGTVSCARCHPLGLFAADGLKTSIGNRCAENPRNAPTILNAAGQISQHWVGNRTSVEDQARQSFVGAGSFGMPNASAVEERLKGIAGYGPLFAAAFPGDPAPVTVARLGEAIGAFERTLVTPSRFDAFIAGTASALTETEKGGLETFLDAGCADCHSGPYVGGGMYAKFGIAAPYWESTKSGIPDEGRYVVTKKEEDRYVFKVPGLRNVAETPPYFHDGSVGRLLEAVGIMARVQLGRDLPPSEAAGILAFLGSLTGRIPDEALLIPILPAAKGPSFP